MLNKIGAFILFLLMLIAAYTDSKKMQARLEKFIEELP